MTTPEWLEARRSIREKSARLLTLLPYTDGNGVVHLPEDGPQSVDVASLAFGALQRERAEQDTEPEPPTAA
jgi:hypothetical protein